MTITWTGQQQAAIDKARRWIDAPLGSVPQVHKIFGYGGTGKSELAKELDKHVGGALAAAYTGKAASVMARKGLPHATTVHRLIYNPAGNDTSHLDSLREELALLRRVEDPGPGLLLRLEAVEGALHAAEQKGGDMRFLLKEESAVGDARLVILDECSMVDTRMAQDLLSFGTRVLVLGDPGQLPPVKGTGYFNDGEPDSMLTEVHRQAAGSPIIRLATLAREGKSLPLGEWETEFGTARVVEKINARQAVAADQILCGTNARRQVINARHRQLGGHTASPMPRAGERLVCLRNDHDMGMLNGTIWHATQDATWETGDADCGLVLEPEGGGPTLGVCADAATFMDEDQRPKWGSAQQLTWGYCLTVHKSQGSQWDKVVLFDDWRSQNRKEWLYTGVTRAAQELTVVVDR